jgi:S-disulfanyl-L-cysteine oxidoreductase SoxD
MFRIVASAFVIFAIVGKPAIAAQSGAVEKTVLDGVYSTPQAERGLASYTTHCGACHGNALEGVSAPPLIGTRFIERWREGMLHPLYDFIRQRMPFGRPANTRTIPDGEYLDILTYMLKANGYRAGENELTAGLLANIMLVGSDGPRPVPDGSHVITVGCLARVGDSSWALSRATEPSRTPTAGNPSPAELNTSLQKRLGTLTFRLADFEAVPDVSPSMHNGHKMQVKGFLVRQQNAERISLTSMEMLDATCGD